MGQRTVRRSVGRLEVHAVEFVPDDAGRPLDVAEPTSEDRRNAAALLGKATAADLPDWLLKLGRWGIDADRWPSPSLLAQLRQATRRPVDTLLCNLLDWDYSLGLNQHLVLRQAAQIAAGTQLIARLLECKRVWAIVDQAWPAGVIETLRREASQLAGSLRIAPIENDYPQADPSLLIYAATRRKLRPGRLPTESAVLLLDGAAAASVGAAVLLGRPTSVVPVLIHDRLQQRTTALQVVRGTTVADALGQANIPVVGPQIIHAGSTLRALHAGLSDILDTGELTLSVSTAAPAHTAEPCVGCGWCAEGCPTRCRPASLLEAAQREDADLADRNGLAACIECGLCTYVCPSRLPILEGIRTLRRTL